MVQGIFPFREAKRSDYFFSMIKRGQLDLYWRTVSGSKLSSEFKDLIISMFEEKGSDRPTLQ